MSWKEDIIRYINSSLSAIKTVVDSLLARQVTINAPPIYIVAEDIGTTEISDDGSSPALTAESSKSNANETAGEADPNWSEDIDFEPGGTTTIISIFYELHWQQKRTGGTTSSGKLQISGDGGSSWVDVTDDITETGTTYADKTRIGTGRHITAVTAGSNQLQMRLVTWSADATSVETKMRSDSYIRPTYKKT